MHMQDASGGDIRRRQAEMHPANFFFIFLVRETKELWLEYIYYIYNDLCMQWNVTRMVS